jgi:Flp pilus assembly protein TadD
MTNLLSAFAAAISVATLLLSSALAKDTPSNMPLSRPDPLAEARTAVASHAWGRAIDLLQHALNSGLDSADLHNLLGYSLRKNSPPDLDRAMEHYRKALDRDPNHLGALEYMGEAYLLRRQPDEARNLLESLRRACGGSTCEEYQELSRSIQQFR